MQSPLLQEISLLSRKNTDCVKWDALPENFGQEDLLPLWVADMDFKTPQCVRQALRQAVDQGVFGYYRIPDRYYDSILSWEKTRHGTQLERSWLRTTSGVVSGLFHLIRALTQPGDGVLLQTPVYYPFFRVVRHTGRRLVCSPLREENGVYTVDLEAFDRTLRDNDVKVFLLCSPHNPVGRVWTRKELAGMLDCCRRHHVQVVADEIHHDLIMPGHTHLSASSLWEGEDKPITFFSASKTFNLAGMKNSVLVIPQKKLRDQFDQFEKELGTGPGSTLDYVAVAAAFSEGGPWLDAVLEEIQGNYQLMKDTLSRFPGVTVSPLEGTYLMWVDLKGVASQEQLRAFVQEKCRIAPDYGHWFYPEKNEDVHIRLNLAAPRQTIQQAARQLEQALEDVLKA